MKNLLSTGVVPDFMQSTTKMMHKVTWFACASQCEDEMKKGKETIATAANTQETLHVNVSTVLYLNYFKLVTVTLRNYHSLSYPSFLHPRNCPFHHCCRGDACGCCGRWSEGSSEAGGPCPEFCGSDEKPTASEQTKNTQKEQFKSMLATSRGSLHL